MAGTRLECERILRHRGTSAVFQRQSKQQLGTVGQGIEQSNKLFAFEVGVDFALAVITRMPLPTTIAEFRTWLADGEPFVLAREFCLGDSVHALPAPADYECFRLKVAKELPAAEFIAIVGSGNWRFSLNPEKLLAEYHAKSDIDVAVVSQELYQSTWDEMRKLHRKGWYTLPFSERDKLRRNGQNVYAGFACPTWIPQRGHPTVYAFKTMLNRLSGPELGYREVKMMYFKNQIEMIDYYRRGFEDAKRGIAK